MVQVEIKMNIIVNKKAISVIAVPDWKVEEWFSHLKDCQEIHVATEAQFNRCRLAHIKEEINIESIICDGVSYPINEYAVIPSEYRFDPFPENINLVEEILTTTIAKKKKARQKN